MFWVTCCHVRMQKDGRLYLKLFVGELTSYLRYLCLFTYRCVQHILCCVFVFVFLRLVYSVFPVSLPLRYSYVNIYKKCQLIPTINFFRNACTKSGSLRFSVFRLLTDFVCLYNYEFWLSHCKIFRSSVILLLPLFHYVTTPYH
jgi:hypothetical protein